MFSFLIKHEKKRNLREELLSTNAIISSKFNYLSGVSDLFLKKEKKK